MTRTRGTVVTVLVATLAAVLLVPPAAASAPAAAATCTEENADALAGTTVRGDLHVDARPAGWEGRRR